MREPAPVADHVPQEPGSASRGALLEIFWVALRLGLTSFGGPIAHLAYFQEEYVRRRRWLGDRAFADIVALCQFLPGPASSQVGIAIGMMRAGVPGGVAAWLGFTLPSALAMALFALYFREQSLSGAGWLRGLLIVAVAVVAAAVWEMAVKLTPDRTRASIALAAAIVTLAAPWAGTQVAVILLGGISGWLLLRDAAAAGEREPGASGSAPGAGALAAGAGAPGEGAPGESIPAAAGPGGALSLSRRGARLAWALFFALLLGLPLVRKVYPAGWLAVLDTFYRAGSLVFGGGHVVLPLLAREVVGAGWITEEQFLAGYGAAQAVPGPLFTFAAYAGAAMQGWPFAALALIAVFAPSFLLVAGALPYWERIRRRKEVRAALWGVNAAVVGILLAALYDPIFTKAIHTPADFSLALGGFGLLKLWRLPSWCLVLLMAAAGMALQALG